MEASLLKKIDQKNGGQPSSRHSGNHEAYGARTEMQEQVLNIDTINI